MLIKKWALPCCGDRHLAEAWWTTDIGLAFCFGDWCKGSVYLLWAGIACCNSSKCLWRSLLSHRSFLRAYYIKHREKQKASTLQTQHWDCLVTVEKQLKSVSIQFSLHHLTKEPNFIHLVTFFWEGRCFVECDYLRLLWVIYISITQWLVCVLFYQCLKELTRVVISDPGDFPLIVSGLQRRKTGEMTSSSKGE